MDKVFRFAADACLVGSGIFVGILIRDRMLQKQFETMKPLLENALNTAVDNAFDTGMTKSEVLDMLNQDLKFIEQVL